VSLRSPEVESSILQDLSTSSSDRKCDGCRLSDVHESRPSSYLDGAAFLALASRSSHAIRANLAKFGDRSLTEHLRMLTPYSARSLQSREDLFAVIYDEARRYYGDRVAELAVRDLRAEPVLPTSNHFGIDTFADSVQGTLLFSSRRLPSHRRETVVVLGCGSVSMSNLTYPMGLLLYDYDTELCLRFPQRLMVIPDQHSRRCVTTCPPYDRQMVLRAQNRLRDGRRAKTVSRFCAAAAERVIEEFLLDGDTLTLPTYAQQATRVNGRMWSALYRRVGFDGTHLVQLELESVCGKLAVHDLLNQESVLYQAYFDDRIRAAMLDHLDGARACWNQRVLRDRLHDLAQAEHHNGTVFFWALSAAGKRVPLSLEHDGASLLLRGIDARRTRYDFAFTPESLVEALQEKRLIPSIVTCFIVLAFARGVTCVGGYYQAEYLPRIQAGVCVAFGIVNQPMAEVMAEVPTDICLAGLQFVVREDSNGLSIPAGPVEMIHAGGLSESDFSQLDRITVSESHLAALSEVLAHVIPGGDILTGSIERLMRLNSRHSRELVRMPS